MSDLGKALEDNLNSFAPMVYSEDIRFEVQASSSGLPILYERSDVLRDIRCLSGAESRLFSMLCMLSLMPLLPEKQRTNLLVLDEPDVNMDDVHAHRLRETLVPAMTEIVPHVIVVTPNQHDWPGARQHEVVKDGNGSRLERVT